MTQMIPPARPEMERKFAEDLLRAAGVDLSKPAILGRRGYYRDAMGVPGKNDRGIYDDALIIVSPTSYVTFNANTDPSSSRVGMAVLEPGLWRYQLGIHNSSKDPKTHQRYLALIQAAPVVVRRDGTESYAKGTKHPTYGECLGNARWRGYFGINHHRGSGSSTSSEGCQTVVPAQYDAYIALVKSEMQRYGMSAIPYLLTAREE